MDVPTVDIISFLKFLGFFSFIAPFLLMFTLFYGLLRKSQIFGPTEQRERLYIIIGMALTAYFVYSFGPSQFTQRFLSFFFYEMLTIIMFLLAISAFFSAFSGKEEGKRSGGSRIISSSIAALLSLTVLIAFLYAAQSTGHEEMGNALAATFKVIYEKLIQSGAIYGIIIILIPLMAIAWAIGGKSQTSFKDKAKKGLEDIEYELDRILDKIKNKKEEQQKQQQK